MDGWSLLKKFGFNNQNSFGKNYQKFFWYLWRNTKFLGVISTKCLVILTKYFLVLRHLSTKCFYQNYPKLLHQSLVLKPNFFNSDGFRLQHIINASWCSPGPVASSGIRIYKNRNQNPFFGRNWLRFSAILKKYTNRFFSETGNWKI